MNGRMPPSHRQTTPARQDWGGLVLAILVLGWIGITSLGTHWIGWLVEQVMLVQSLLAFMGIQLIKHDFAERYSHAFVGLVIALTGISVMVLGI